LSPNILNELYLRVDRGLWLWRR